MCAPTVGSYFRIVILCSLSTIPSYLLWGHRAYIFALSTFVECTYIFFPAMASKRTWKKVAYLSIPAFPQPLRLSASVGQSPPDQQLRRFIPGPACSASCPLRPVSVSPLRFSREQASSRLPLTWQIQFCVAPFYALPSSLSSRPKSAHPGNTRNDISVLQSPGRID